MDMTHFIHNIMFDGKSNHTDKILDSFPLPLQVLSVSVSLQFSHTDPYFVTILHELSKSIRPHYENPNNVSGC